MFNFLKKKPQTVLDRMIIATYGQNPPKAQRADINLAIDLASSALLMGSIEKAEVDAVARGLFHGRMPYSTHDLAIATALNFFRRSERREELSAAQLLARLTASEWLQEGKIAPLLARTFEETLYKDFR